MRYLDSSTCPFIKPEIAKVLTDEYVVRAVFTVREEKYLARHALILYGGQGMEPLLVTSETDYFTSGYEGAGTRNLLTTVYLLLGFDVRISYVALDGDRPFPPHRDAEQNKQFLTSLAKDARPLILSVATLGDEANEDSAYCAFNLERGSLMVSR